MIKALRAFRRAPGMGREEFLERWEEHAQLVLAVPGLRGYVQSRRVGRDEQSTAPFDGYSAWWFDDEAALARALRSPEARAAVDDRRGFTAADGVQAATVVAHVAHDAPVGPDAVKMVFVFRRRVGLAPEVFRRHWLDVHGPLVVQYIAGLGRFVQNCTVDSAYADGADPDFDGLAEAWVADLPTLDEMETSPEHDLVRSDEPNFVDVNRVMHLVAAERVHRAPGD